MPSEIPFNSVPLVRLECRTGPTPWAVVKAVRLASVGFGGPVLTSHLAADVLSWWIPPLRTLSGANTAIEAIHVSVQTARNKLDSTLPVANGKGTGPSSPLPPQFCALLYWSHVAFGFVPRARMYWSGVRRDLITPDLTGLTAGGIAVASAVASAMQNASFPGPPSRQWFLVNRTEGLGQAPSMNNWGVATQLRTQRRRMGPRKLVLGTIG